MLVRSQAVTGTEGHGPVVELLLQDLLNRCRVSHVGPGDELLLCTPGHQQLVVETHGIEYHGVVEVVTQDGLLGVGEAVYAALKDATDLDMLEFGCQVLLALSHEVRYQLIHLRLVAEVQLLPAQPAVDDRFGLAILYGPGDPVDWGVAATDDLASGASSKAASNTGDLVSDLGDVHLDGAIVAKQLKGRQAMVAFNHEDGAIWVYPDAHTVGADQVFGGDLSRPEAFDQRLGVGLACGRVI